MTRWRAILALTVSAGVARGDGLQRINQEGRILGPLPAVTNSILFDTTNADAVVSAMQVFPVTSAYNEDVSQLPLLSNSAAMIAQISSDLGSSRQDLQLFQEMNYVLTPDTQALVSVDFVDYPDQSDLNGGTYPYGLYPIPTNMPIEGWPTQTEGETLAQAQVDAFGEGGDRHGIIVEPEAGRSFEMWETLLATNWQAANGAIFDLTNNSQRPAGWTSGDAAGLSMFGPLVRFDECERGMVEHACRLVVKRSRYNNYIYPATHFAAPSGNTNVNLPSMGQRLRLKASFVIPANWTKEEKAILLGLKKYGALVADNGNFFSISIAPDDRWPANAFNDIYNTVNLTNFEVVQSTRATGGPRSPGAPTAFAGPDETVPVGQAIPLQGYVNYSAVPPAILWTLYSGPGAAAFSDAALTNGTATFSKTGTYILELSAADGVHAVAYDTATFTVVSNPIVLTAKVASPNVSLSWIGAAPPYVIQESGALAPLNWRPAATTSMNSILIPLTNTSEFFRVEGQ